MFKPEEFKKGDKVIVFMQSKEGQEDLGRKQRIDYGDILLRGDIEHVWNGTEETYKNHGEGFLFNIRAHSQNDVLHSKIVDGEPKPTFLTIVKEDAQHTVWIKKYDEALFNKLWALLTSRVKLIAALAVEDKAINELLK